MQQAVDIASALCRRFEGLYLRPYLCPAGVPTIGYGTTAYENNIRVTLADPPISSARAESLLQWELRTVCLPAVQRLCPTATTPERVAALLDFAFNLGIGALSSSTMRQYVLREDWPTAATELNRWVYSRGKVLKGLVLRRAAEATLMATVPQGPAGAAPAPATSPAQAG